MTPIRSRSWSIEATTLKSTTKTSTTEALRQGSVSTAGAGVLAISSGVTLVAMTVFQGLSPAWIWAA